jgi:hypothetical protein
MKLPKLLTSKHFFRLLTFIAIKVAVVNLIFYVFSKFWWTTPDTSLIILKLPRSGSTWFTESMNKYSNIFVSKEIIQSSDKRYYSADKMEHHLALALASPTSKISKWTYFSGRFWDDYIFKFKYLHSMYLIGFSLNPENSQGNL